MPDKIVIVTGASRGIGRATAIELVSRGCSVALIARSRPELEETARLCKSAGGRALILPGDITDESTATALLEQTVNQFGRLDGLVNNAGYAPQASVDETDTALFRRVIDTNLTAALTLSRLAWPHLKRSGVEHSDAAPSSPAAEQREPMHPPEPAAPYGRSVAAPAATINRVPAPGPCIVNLSSMSAVDPLPGFAAYAAAKAGLLGLTKVLAREGAEHNIRSVALILGGTETAMFRGLKGAEHVPAESLLAPQEVARVIAECLTGPLAYSSGEGIYLRKRV